MDSDKLIDKENNNIEEEVEISQEKLNYEKISSKRDYRKFTLIPKKIKRLKDNKNAANSGINLSQNHIRLQLRAGNKMMVMNQSNKYKIILSKNFHE